MDPLEASLQVAQTATSGATGSTSVPFVNNAELIFGSSGIDQGGITGSNPDASLGETASSAAQPAAAGAAAVADASASGQSALVWVSVAGVVVALLLAFKGKLAA